MAFLFKLFVFASLCVLPVLSYECNQNGLIDGFKSGKTFSLNCTNPPIVWITQTIEVKTNFTWQMDGVILRSTADTNGNKFGLIFTNSTFAISNGVIEVPISIKNSVAIITSVNVRNFNATGDFSSSISSINSSLTFTRSSTFATAGAQGTLYVSGGMFTCLQSSLIFNSGFNVTGASFSFDNMLANVQSIFYACTIKGQSLSFKNSNFVDYYLIDTTSSIWDVPTVVYARAFYGDYNVYQSTKDSANTAGYGNTYGAQNIFEAPIESPVNYIGAPTYSCPFATAWVPLAACSPALDVVPYSRYEKDQNGSPRQQNGAVDAGAIESYLKPCLGVEFSKKVTQCVKSVVLTLTLSSKSAVNVSVRVTTQDSTAFAGVDYIAFDQTIVFQAGLQTSINITIGLIKATVLNGPMKTFRVSYTDAVNAEFAKDAITAVKLQCSSPFTTSIITSSAMTTAQVTSASFTSSQMTTAILTTSPLTTAQMTTVTPLTTLPLTTAAITTSAVTSASMTTATTTAALTTGLKLTSYWMTTAPKVEVATTGAPKMTTGYAAGQPNTTTECDALTVLCKTGSCKYSTTFTIDGAVYSYSDFNAISFGDFYLADGDTEGRLLVGGSFYADNKGISIGYELKVNSFPYSAIVGGDAVVVNGEIYPRGTGMFVGSKFTGADNIRAQITGSCAQAGCLKDEFTKMKNFFVDISKTLAALTSTATAELSYSKLNVNCNSGATVQIISIDAATLSAATEYELIGCPSSAMFLFNVKGTSVSVFQGREFPSPATLYNIVESAKVYVNATVVGSILAPVSTYTQVAGYVQGQIVVNSNTATVQINMPGCLNVSTTGNGDDGIQEGGAATTVFSFVLAVILSLAIVL